MSLVNSGRRLGLSSNDSVRVVPPNGSIDRHHTSKTNRTGLPEVLHRVLCTTRFVHEHRKECAALVVDFLYARYVFLWLVENGNTNLQGMQTSLLSATMGENSDLLGYSDWRGIGCLAVFRWMEPPN